MRPRRSPGRAARWGATASSSRRTPARVRRPGWSGAAGAAPAPRRGHRRRSGRGRWRRERARRRATRAPGAEERAMRTWPGPGRPAPAGRPPGGRHRRDRREARGWARRGTGRPRCAGRPARAAGEGGSGGSDAARRGCRAARAGTRRDARAASGGRSAAPRAYAPHSPSGTSVRRRPAATGAPPWSSPSLSDDACLPTVSKSNRCNSHCTGPRTDRCRCLAVRSRRSRLTSNGSAASASGRSTSALSTW